MSTKSEVGVSPNSTNLFGESLKWFNNSHDFEWHKRSNGIKDFSNSLLGNFVEWTSQPYLSILKDNIHAQSYNQQEVDLLPLPPSIYDQ